MHSLQRSAPLRFCIIAFLQCVHHYHAFLLSIAALKTFLGAVSTDLESSGTLDCPSLQRMPSSLLVAYAYGATLRISFLPALHPSHSTHTACVLHLSLHYHAFTALRSAPLHLRHSSCCAAAFMPARSRLIDHLHPTCASLVVVTPFGGTHVVPPTASASF